MDKIKQKSLAPKTGKWDVIKRRFIGIWILVLSFGIICILIINAYNAYQVKKRTVPKPQITQVTSQKELVTADMHSLGAQILPQIHSVKSSPSLYPELSVDKTGSQTYEEGLVAEGNHQWEKAIQIYQEELKKKPNQPDLWKRIADISNHLKRYGEAAEAFKKAIQLQPSKASYYAELAVTYQAMKKFDDALMAIHSAVELKPNNPDYLRRQTQMAKDAAITAEMKKDWPKALAIYKSMIEKNANQPELWKKIAELETVLKNYDKAIDALKQAIRLQSTNLNLYILLSDVYIAHHQIPEAFDIIEEALKQDPNKISLLLKKAQAAIGLKAYDLADDTYQHILCLDIINKDALLGSAQLLSMRNSLDKAAIAFHDFLMLYPDEKNIWIDYAKIQSWRGAYPEAFEIIEVYRCRFGETEEYLAEKARLLALDGYYEQALSLVDALLEKKPNDFDLHYTRIIALKGDNQFDQALTGLDFISEHYPDHNKDIEGLNKFITRSLRSHINFDPYTYYDSVKIRVTGSQIFGEYFVCPDLSFIYGVKHEKLTAPINSGFQTFDNHQSIWDASQGGGFCYHVTNYLDTSAQIGIGEIQRRKNYVLYELNAHYRTDDILDMTFQKGQNLYSNLRDLRNSRVLFAISPLSVSLGILQFYNRLAVSLRLGERVFINASGEYDTFSDHNKLWFFNIQPRVTAMNSQYFNVDLGLYGLSYGFAREANNGYYSPLSYQLYQATAMITFKASENMNFVLAAAAGEQRDNVMEEFEFAGDLSFKAIFGLFSDWQFILSANALSRNGAFNLGNDLRGNNMGTGGFLYNQYTFEGILTKRF